MTETADSTPSRGAAYGRAWGRLRAALARLPRAGDGDRAGRVHRRILGLSHSGGVRIVKRLEGQRLLAREPEVCGHPRAARSRSRRSAVVVDDLDVVAVGVQDVGP